jgi:hypothetical protein
MSKRYHVGMSQTVIFHDNTISHTECQHFFNLTEPAP